MVVVDPDEAARGRTTEALDHRFGADYRVLAEASPAAALALLEELAERGEPVALVAADLHLPGGRSSSSAARTLCTARRVALSCSPWTSTTPGSRSASWRRCSGRRRSA
jgi:thioredoxin reductase (NADPH)